MRTGTPTSLPSSDAVQEALTETLDELDKPLRDEHTQFQSSIDQSDGVDTLNMLAACGKRSAVDMAFVSPEHALALLQAGATALHGSAMRTYSSVTA